MLSELIRVTKPAGAIAVIVRATDMPRQHGLPARPELKAKVDTTGWGAGAAPNGCADASLYRRFRDAGLLDVIGYPQLATVDPGPYFDMNQAQVRAMLGDEVPEWQAALTQAQTDGSFFVALPYHCAIGRKPGEAPCRAC
jgi:hypothetical protein